MPENKTFYDVYGSGKPIVLLHGFAETGAVWVHQTNYLKKHFKVIVPDLPGCGKSPELNIEPPAVTIEDYVESIYLILKKENIESCTMFGHSMGGYITLAIADKYHKSLCGFGFVHSTAFADTEEKKQTRLRGIEMIENYGSYAFLKNTTPNLFTQKFKDEHSAEVVQLLEQGKSFSKKSLQQAYYAMMNRNEKTSVLETSNLPVMFIAGKQDNAVPLKDVLKQVHLPEISYFHIINHVGHMGLWEASEIVNESIEEFVNEIA